MLLSFPGHGVDSSNGGRPWLSGKDALRRVLGLPTSRVQVPLSATHLYQQQTRHACGSIVGDSRLVGGSQSVSPKHFLPTEPNVSCSDRIKAA